MGVEHEGSEKRRQITSVIDSIELVEHVTAFLEARKVEDADEITHSGGGSGVEGITEVALAEQRATSAASPSIWAILLFPPVMAQLRCLDLSFNEFDDTFWAIWSPKDDERALEHGVEWSVLSALTLSNNRFTSASIPAIAAFATKCPCLKRLDLSLNPLGSVRRAAALTEQIPVNSVNSSPLMPLLDALEGRDAKEGLMNHLEVLDLSCIGSWQQCCGQKSVEQFERFMQTLQTTHSSLRQLQLRSIALTDDHAVVIADSLPTMTTLEELELSGNEISDTGAARFAFVLDRTTNLRSLDLASNQITRKGFVVFQRMISLLRESFALRLLFLEHNVDIPSHDLTRLYELMQAKVLETHLLSVAEVTSPNVGDGSETMEAGMALSLSGKVATYSLALGGCLVDRHVRVVMDVLRTAHKWQALRELDLSGNRIGVAGSAAIALYLALHPLLRLLNLSANAMDDAATVMLANGVEANVTLEELDLSKNAITDAGATTLYLKAFSRVLDKRRRIHVINGNALTPKCQLALQSIAQAHDLRKHFDTNFAALEHLNLSGKMLRHYGARAIADKLLTMDKPSCSSLDLSRNSLGDDGALVVARLISKYARLEKLDLSFNEIGDAGAAAIADALAENSTLQSLTLHSAPDGSVVKPRLTEAGLVQVALALQTHRAIASVDFRNNMPSPGVTRALLALVRANRNLQRVNGASAAAFMAKHSEE